MRGRASDPCVAADQAAGRLLPLEPRPTAWPCHRCQVATSCACSQAKSTTPEGSDPLRESFPKCATTLARKTTVAASCCDVNATGDLRAPEHNCVRIGRSLTTAFYSARVEYALHTLLNLSLVHAGAAPSATELAEFQQLPLMYVRKLLTQLEKAGLVTATEGVRGGWRLARDPNSISVLEIAEAARGNEGPLFQCQEIRARCALWPRSDPPRQAVTGVCSIHAVMIAAGAAMRRELASHTLADLNARVRAKSSRAWRADVESWFADRYKRRRRRSA